MFGHGRLLIILTIILSATSGNAQDRIIGGHDAENRVRYQASIRNEANRHVCSGTVINSLFILTAAECISKNINHIYVGSNSLRYGTKYIIQKKIPHENFDSLRNVHNLGLIKTNVNIIFGNDVGLILSLPWRFGDNEALIMTGWGSREISGGLSVKIQELRTISNNQRDCSTMLDEVIPNEIICTYTKRGQGACNGDIGNPIVTTNHWLVGIMTSKYTCGNGPDQSTRVQPYLWWIFVNILRN